MQRIMQRRCFYCKKPSDEEAFTIIDRKLGIVGCPLCGKEQSVGMLRPVKTPVHIADEKTITSSGR